MENVSGGGGGITNILANAARQDNMELEDARIARNMVPAKMDMDEAFFHSLREIIAQKGYTPSS